MKLEERFSLNRLVALSLGASLLLPFTLIGLLLFNAFGRVPSSRAGILFLFIGSLVLPMAFALVAIFAARNAVRRGLMDERWPASEQTKQYERLRSKTWKWTVGTLLLSAIALPMISLLRLSLHGHSHPWGGLVYFLIAPVMARTELLKLLAPPRLSDEKTWLHDIKPIQSTHWGQPENSPRPN